MFLEYPKQIIDVAGKVVIAKDRDDELLLSGKVVEPSPAEIFTEEVPVAPVSELETVAPEVHEEPVIDHE